jgi:hypothetical protein
MTQSFLKFITKLDSSKLSSIKIQTTFGNMLVFDRILIEENVWKFYSWELA